MSAPCVTWTPSQPLEGATGVGINQLLPTLGTRTLPRDFGDVIALWRQAAALVVSTLACPR